MHTQSDYPSAVAGKIALISRGTCAFGQKSALAGAAGAAAAILYNNVNGTLGGTLSPGPRPEGAYIPTIGIAQELGVGYVAAIKSGASISATINVKTEIQNMTTYNVLATTKTGERTNKLCLGAHTDSVAEGPGLNDDGSGTIGILEVAKALAKYQVHNAVVFGFWAAEEAGLVGSKHFVSSLSAEDLAKIRAYLNFDMVSLVIFFPQPSPSKLASTPEKKRGEGTTDTATPRKTFYILRRVPDCKPKLHQRHLLERQRANRQRSTRIRTQRILRLGRRKHQTNHLPNRAFGPRVLPRRRHPRQRHLHGRL